MKVVLTSSVLALYAAISPVSAQVVTDLYQLNISRQALDAALKDLAQQTGLQIARFSDTPDGSALVGPVAGKVSIDQALNSLLTPSGLTYKVVNDRTIAIVQRNAGTSSSRAEGMHSAGAATAAENVDGVALGQTQNSENVPQTAQSSPQTNPPPSQEPAGTQLTEVVVTGFRQSLEDAALEKRRNTHFTDSIFAEDIGKFPDLNLAESLQRLPGIQIERDASGEGTRINIRGLGSNFTVLSMNGAQLQTASDNSVGFVNDGRGSSLDLFPTELFQSLTISKTPLASQIEGGVAGNVGLRPIRPFDKDGLQFSWQVKGLYEDVSEKTSPRAGVFASNTWDTESMGRFGILAGVAYAEKQYRSDTFNTIGYTTFNLATDCPRTQPGCNSQSFLGNAPSNPTYGFGGSAALPATVPVGTGFGLVDGADYAPCGPGGTSGLDCNTLSYTAIPRLGRAEVVEGKRERTAAIITSQWQATDALLVNLDLIGARTQNDFNQHDLMLTVRSTGNNIPIDFQVNERNVLTHGTFANAQLLSENRPFKTDADFWASVLGTEYQLTDRLKLKGSVAYNESAQDQSANTVLLRTTPNSGLAVTYDLVPGALTPTLSVNRDPNDPNLGWQWDTMRVQPHHRTVSQQDAQFSVEWGEPDFLLSSGLQYTKFDRNITTWDLSHCATNAQAPTNAQCADSAFAGVRALIPDAQLGNYMTRWTYGQLYNQSDFNVGLNNGWAIPDFNKMFSVVNLDYFENQYSPVNRGDTIQRREINEATGALFVQVDGTWEMFSMPIKYNAGVRGFRTDQEVSGIVRLPDPTTNTSPRVLQSLDTHYIEYLPSLNASIDLREDLVFRLAGGRTMTRPNPGDIAPTFDLNVSADTLTIGNPALEPFFSDQVDLGLEWYINPRNTLALNLWQKKIDGFSTIFRENRPFGSLGIPFDTLINQQRDNLQNRAGPGGDVNNVAVTVNQRRNTTEVITLRGVELTLLQPLDFLLEGLGFTANYTHIDQKSEGAPPGAGTRLNPGSAVVGLSPNTYNLSIFFERPNFSSRLSYNYRDPFVAFTGPQNNFEGDGVAIKSQYLDGSLSMTVPGFESARITLEGLNLLNQYQFTRLDGFGDLPFDARAPGRSFILGLAGRF